MTQISTAPAGPVDAAQLEQQIRARIDSLSYLPTTVAVAMKFIELGKDPAAEPSDYAKVVSSDSSLSTKLLAMANSPWFGIRNKVTSVKMAVNFLGLGTVRTMAISYCIAGLHNELRLTPDESRMFWEASLFKGVAARHFAKAMDEELAEQGFVAGMFQDFALPIMYSAAKEQYLAILEHPDLGWEARLEAERELFRLDHAEVGRILAEKLELPDMFVDAVAFHHNHERLTEFMENELVGHAIHAASLFPTVLNVWNPDDADRLCRFLDEHIGTASSESTRFLQDVQQEFNQMYHYFEDKEPPETRLAELMIQAAKEGADQTTHLVASVSQLMQEAASMGIEVNQLVKSHNQLKDKATHDQLTDVLNREGFTNQANELLAKAARYGTGFAVLYLDVDKFKSINDTLGHEFGDRALKIVSARMSEAVRQQDLMGRMGGDEFALIIYDCTEPDAKTVAGQILSQVASEPIGRGKGATTISLSAGLLYLRPSNKEHPLDTLISVADKLMYQAKRGGGNQIQTRIV